MSRLGSSGLLVSYFLSSFPLALVPCLSLLATLLVLLVSSFGMLSLRLLLLRLLPLVLLLLRLLFL